MCQLLMFRHFQRRGGLCAEVESMHVHPDFRGKGIGGQLLNAAVDAARQAGCYRVQLTSNLQRADAHRFYQRHGFVPSHVGFNGSSEPTVRRSLIHLGLRSYSVSASLLIAASRTSHCSARSSIHSAVFFSVSGRT